MADIVWKNGDRQIANFRGHRGLNRIIIHSARNLK